MKISVILCTYNRCESLAKALSSVGLSILPPSVLWEVLVVDNNCKDQTRQVAKEFVSRYPGRFRYLSELQPGKSHALNAGIREADGDILAFMDDDVTVDEHWLENLTSVFSEGEWAGAGGRILPERFFSPPKWLSLDDKYALAPLAIFDLGVDAGEMHEPPFGTNMAFRREVFEKVGGFRTDLGPRPGSEARAEDTEFGDRALAAGFRLWYQPSAVVYHSLPAHRIQRRYFLDWWYAKARTDIRQEGIPAGTKWRVAGVPLYLFRRLAVWAFRWMFSFESKRRFDCKLKVFRAAGAMRECFAQSSAKSLGDAKAQEVSGPTSAHLGE